MSFILAIDQGTTSTKSVILNKEGAILGIGQAEFPQHYPKAGWVEHYGEEIKASVKKSVETALKIAAISPSSLAGIGITNQRETLCLFNKNSQPALPFIVWQCRRSQEICERLKQKNLAIRLHQITGLLIDPYFTASKLQWVMEHYPNIKDQLKNGECLAGTVDSFLAHWLSAGQLHISDVTNASRTMLMDLKSCTWSDECLEIFGIPKRCLPDIVPCTGPFGFSKGLDFLPDGIPIAALAGDQHAALFGHNCFQPGDAKATFGTGCFILQNTGRDIYFSKHGLLSTVAYQIDAKPQYCLEGSAFIAGAAISFLIDAFGLIKDSSEIESLARSVKDNGGVIFIPALCGLGAPHWQPDISGTITGLSRGTQKGHIARATLEGIALQNTDIIEAMALDSRSPNLLKVDGGASRDDLLMQIQADLLKLPCIRSKSPHKTAIGIAHMAGLALGIYRDLEQLRGLHDEETEFYPNSDPSWALRTIKAYKKVLGMLLGH
jgi:glycerol kinase